MPRVAREYGMAAADARWPAVAVLANVASQVTRALRDRSEQDSG